MFSWEFCEISKNTFFREHLRVTASVWFLHFYIFTSDGTSDNIKKEDGIQVILL